MKAVNVWKELEFHFTQPSFCAFFFFFFWWPAWGMQRHEMNWPDTQERVAGATQIPNVEVWYSERSELWWPRARLLDKILVSAIWAPNIILRQGKGNHVIWLQVWGLNLTIFICQPFIVHLHYIKLMMYLTFFDIYWAPLFNWAPEMKKEWHSSWH